VHGRGFTWALHRCWVRFFFEPVGLGRALHVARVEHGCKGAAHVLQDERRQLSWAAWHLVQHSVPTRMWARTRSQSLMGPSGSLAEGRGLLTSALGLDVEHLQARDRASREGEKTGGPLRGRAHFEAGPWSLPTFGGP